MVLSEVMVVTKRVAWALDMDKEARYITTKRNSLPGFIQQENGDSLCMRRLSLCAKALIGI